MKEVLYIISRSRFHVAEGEVRRRRINGERPRNKRGGGRGKRVKEKEKDDNGRLRRRFLESWRESRERFNYTIGLKVFLFS